MEARIAVLGMLLLFGFNSSFLQGLQTVRPPASTFAKSATDRQLRTRTRPPHVNFGWKPSRLFNGSPFLIRVQLPPTVSSLHGNWLGRQVVFSRSHVERCWYAFAAVDVGAAPGYYPFSLEAVTTEGKTLRWKELLQVRKATYHQTTMLRVPEEYVLPDAETLVRIERERALKAEIFSHISLAPEWSGSFAAPVGASISEGFGTRRIFNGALENVHRGLDYRVPTGTEVVAANSGRVILARELFYEGNCVVIDHGQGLLTMYLHLSQIRVEEGKNIERGEVLGLTGATGRVTGPHLHLAASWQGMALDPARLLALDMPRRR